MNIANMTSSMLRKDISSLSFWSGLRRCLLFVFIMICLSASAEDGSQLWMRYVKVGTAQITAPHGSATIDIAVSELRAYWQGAHLMLRIDNSMPEGDGYRLHGDTLSARNDIGLLYGAYALLRIQKVSGHPLCPDMQDYPKFSLRLLNHWDNPDGSVERGYAGKSIFKWDEIDIDGGKMSETLKHRLTEYCRANASVGINGSVLNNVNASPRMLSGEYLYKVKHIADLFRPYGIRVYLSVNFASPMALGFTKTADPLDRSVKKWWADKAKEIYKLIPDFGGFLVKANSEGQPGPGDYHRTHADGANMLADAVALHGGIIMWRSFVYGANHKGEDRVKQAVSEFKGLDGQFRPNVILQSKNGPLDFQPREPYAPIFDNISHTTQMAELQITQEYTGQSKHLVYLAPMWKEFFSFVAPARLKGIAGVANIGDDADWTGHHFSQANWYAFGRLAWNPGLDAGEIAGEWLAQTFSDQYYFVRTMQRMMMTSREACVDYMMPLGLHHIFKFDHHYGPEPDGFKADYPIEWCPVYYHKADTVGIGFDRSPAGSNAVAQYRHPYDSIYGNLQTCPDEYLLWFHHVPWNYRMKGGNTLWQEMVARYNRGVNAVDEYVRTWQQMKPYVDTRRWEEVDGRLHVQQDNACEWRDVCLKYFRSLSKQ